MRVSSAGAGLVAGANFGLLVQVGGNSLEFVSTRHHLDDALVGLGR